VTPEAARRIVLENVDVVSGTETLPLHAAVRRIAAEDLLSAVALPGFDNAAVDGFGSRYCSLIPGLGVKLSNDILAGPTVL
jgi:molybdopterin molybdotransferase